MKWLLLLSAFCFYYIAIWGNISKDTSLLIGLGGAILCALGVIIHKIDNLK